MKQERAILDLLKKEGPMLYNTIIVKTRVKRKWKEGFSATQLNSYLNGMVEKNWVFRIEKDGKIWYRINDFRTEIQNTILLLKLLELIEPKLKPLAATYAENLCEPHDTRDTYMLALTVKQLEMEERLRELWESQKLRDYAQRLRKGEAESLEAGLEDLGKTLMLLRNFKLKNPLGTLSCPDTVNSP